MTSPADRKAFNAALIEEFRANGGKVGGRFEGRPVVLLTTTGAKSGRRITTPLVYLQDGERGSSSPRRPAPRRTLTGTTTWSPTRR